MSGRADVAYDIYTATTRSVLMANTGRVRGDGGVSYGTITISVPPTHTTGTMSITSGTPDPAEHFAVRRIAASADAAAFRQQVNVGLRGRTGEALRGLVFVHGFNNTLADGAFRVAQLVHDYELAGLAMHYAWPSLGSPLGYAYDRDSMLFARNGLEDMLDTLAETDLSSVTLVAHSMGALLTVETLRQIALQGKGDLLNRLEAVILISPDIDVDVFRSQMEDIPPLRGPIVILTSGRDRALRLSARLTGETNRLGSLQGPGPLADLDVTVIDVTAFDDAESTHMTAFTSPSLIPIIQRLREIGADFQDDAPTQTGLLPGAVLSVQEATLVVLAPVTAITDALQ